MVQNRSTAVMQRRIEVADSLDYFPTPLWGTRALCEHVLSGRAALRHLTAWEPACGELHMARPLAEYFGDVVATDVHPYGGHQLHDFLLPMLPRGLALRATDWIITNPPFRLADQFVQRGLELGVNVAVLVRVAFLEGIGRYQTLYRDTPPTRVAYFVERLPMVKGRLDPDATTATAYCWLIWQPGRTPRRPLWIPPCRRQLERAGDYPVVQPTPESEGALL